MTLGGASERRVLAGPPEGPADLSDLPAGLRRSGRSGWSPAQLSSRQARARRQALELLGGHPARDREEAAVGHKREPLGRDGLETDADSLRHIVGSLHVKGLHVN